ncbi:RsmE family RNA methyltransferase [Stieleria varia]|uniref:Ribosomal RNA small subunit methyltransferase E n=1 Tax=Stieleria varia TaxID=2528005 RepID=A0A5C6ATA5_9BACT|nr:RsmE family RNA methyltransferase [Stieleria varia]TWU02242.1 Ribosomal RNA small subunit methyltransferase E [Stieleria varia]
MTRRYYVPDLPPIGGPIALPDEEAQHASRVMRAQTGDQVVLFDGIGNESSATIQSIDRRSCICHASPRELVDREPGLRLHLGIALPKPDRAKEMVERLTELGVAQVTPLLCSRSQRPPSGGLLDKLRRVVIEACKQSGRNQLMRIESPVAVADFFAMDTETPRWIAHPGGQEMDGSLSRLTGGQLLAAIGPEGGFDDEEMNVALSRGWIAIDLGKRIYRIETAATVIAAHASHLPMR